MTPHLFSHITWRIQVWTFRLETRLKSEHAAVRESAREHEREADILRSLLDTPLDDMTDAQRVWYAWIDRAAALYREYHRDAQYAALVAGNLAQRDRELMALRSAA